MPYDNIPEEFRPLDLTEGTTNSFGQPVIGGEAASTRATREEQEAANEQTWYNTLGIGGDENTETLVDGVVDTFTSGGNWGYDILESYRRAYENPYDPKFDAQKWTQENAQKYGIDEQYLPAFGGVGSEKEANALLQNINSRKEAQQRIQRMGITGQLASGLIAGAFDIDTLLSGGVGVFGKTGVMATRMGRIMSGTAIGTTSAAIGAAASPEDDWQNVAVAALFSAGLSSLGRDGKPDPLHAKINEGIEAGRVDLDASLKRAKPDEDFRPAQAVERPAFAPDPEPVPDVVAKPVEKPAGEAVEKVERNPTTFDASEVTMDVQDEVWEAGRRSGDKGSIGARQLTQQDADFIAPSPSVTTIQQRAQQIVQANDLENRYFYDFAKGASKAAQTTANALRKTVDAIGAAGLVTDFDKMFKSGSTTAKAFAYEFLSDGSGRLTNLKSAVHLRDDWRDQLRAEWYKPTRDAFEGWAKTQGVSMWNPRAYGRARDEFNKKVILAQEDMRLNGAHMSTQDPHVIAAATAIDNWSKLDVKIGKGNGTTTAIPGYERMKEQVGYFPRKVSSSKAAAVIRDSARNPSKYGRVISEKDVEQMWTEFYAYGGLSMEDAGHVAKMVLARAKGQDRGADMSLYGLLQGDGAEFLRSALVAQGMPGSRVDSIMRSLVRDAETRGMAGHVQGRLDGDVRFQASNGLKVIDFIDTDIEGILTYRSANTAGRAAAAAKGLRTQKDADAMIEAILDEQQRKIDNPISFSDAMQGNKLDGAKSYANDFLDKDRPINREYLQSMMAQYFGGQTITDKNAALITRMKRMTVLATMNSLGLTQIAETGALMGAVGWREFVRQLPAAVKSDLTNPRSALIQELHSMGKLIPEEHLYNPRYMADLDMSLHAQSEQMQLFDAMVGKGLEIQGLISGMHHVRYAQQKMAMMVTIDRLFQALAGKVPDAISAERLAQIGIDPAMMAKLKSVVQAGHIQFDGKNVKMLNTKAWGDQELVDDFGRAMGIATDQLVQKARLGESNSFFAGNGVASLFGQFLSYPLTAITKQAARNAYAGDTEAMYQVMYGFVMAGMVGMAKATIAGRYEDLNPVDFAKQGFVQANITGWVPLVSDPLMTLLGANELRFNPYGDIIRTPPPIDVINRTLKSPSALAGVITGDVSKENLRNLRYIPLLGNWYGMTALTNRL